jgi:ABC-type sugar transport system ATPase subunit
MISLHGVDGAMLRDFSLDVRPGEIVGISGISGIVGSGAAEVGPILAGMQARFAGEVRIAGASLPRRFGPRRSQQAGVGYVPADRTHDDGLGGADPSSWRSSVTRTWQAPLCNVSRPENVSTTLDKDQLIRLRLRGRQPHRQPVTCCSRGRFDVPAPAAGNRKACRRPVGRRSLR